MVQPDAGSTARALLGVHGVLSVLLHCLTKVGGTAGWAARVLRRYYAKS